MEDMTIDDLIKELQKYPNQKAKANFIANVINEDDEVFDIDGCKISFFQQDVDNVDMYDIAITLSNESESSRDCMRDESIRCLLEEHNRLTIKLNNDPLSCENIVILNENDDVLREISVSGRYSQTDNVSVILSSIIG